MARVTHYEKALTALQDAVDAIEVKLGISSNAAQQHLDAIAAEPQPQQPPAAT